MADNLREHIDEILGRFGDIDSKLESLGGVGRILEFFEGVKSELDAVSHEELEHIAAEIKSVVEALLTLDYEVRKVQNLKLLFEKHVDSREPKGDAGE